MNDGIIVESSEAIIVTSDVIERNLNNRDYGDTKLEKIISEIVTEMIQTDVRLSETPETREALRDYVRMEIILSMKFKDAVLHPDKITTADERMIRSAVKMKMDIRREIYEDVKGKPGKEREMGVIREHLEDRMKVIKAGTDVDILDQ